MPSTVATTSTFVADGGVGTYGFQGRIRQVATGAASLYSAPVFITVTG